MRLIPRRQFLHGTAGLVLAPWLSSCSEYAADVPRSRYDASSTAEEVTQGLDLSGKTALVTGCNSGIGFETMRVLALRGAHVLGTARSARKGRRACRDVQGHCTPLLLELSDLDSVAACADEVRSLADSLDILVCNAGVLFSEHRQINGVELHFLVNHLGHFLLVNRLLDVLRAADSSRVVVVSSESHRAAPREGIRFDDLSGRDWFEHAYGHSKLANGLFAFELARRLDSNGPTANALHPGRVATNIFRNVGRPNFSDHTKNLPEGAATSCYLATHPALSDVSGYYFVDCNPKEPSAAMKDAGIAEKLWTVSESLVTDYLD